MNDRFYCPNCMMFLPDSKVKTRRLFPHTRPPWPLFEYTEVPVCPVCDSEDGDLIDTFFEKVTPPDLLQNVFGALPDFPEVRLIDKQQQGQERKEDE
jgi:hypothetical protein